MRIQTGETERIEVVALDASRDPVTGKSDLLLQIRRVSDGQYYDFNDDTFKAAGWTTRQQALTETDATNDPGNYHYDFDTSAITNPTADDTYQMRVDQSPGTDVKNLPATGELHVGQFVDDIDAAISTRSSHTAASVWAVGTRTLTSFGTLVADVATAVWGAVTRTLTAGTRDSEIDDIQTKVTFAYNVAGGRWLIDETANQLILYEDDNTTEIARFNLLDESGSPAYTDVFERVRV